MIARILIVVKHFETIFTHLHAKILEYSKLIA